MDAARDTGNIKGGETQGPVPFDVKPVEPERVRVWEDAFHVLHVSINDATHDDVRPVRAFPISGKADYISFLGEDRKEVALVAHPDRLEPSSREALESALERMYYIPKITRIYSIVEKWGIGHWEVETDRGFAAFEVAARENIRKLPNGRFLLQDVDGNRFEIVSVYDLDKKSQYLVESET